MNNWKSWDAKAINWPLNWCREWLMERISVIFQQEPSKVLRVPKISKIQFSAPRWFKKQKNKWQVAYIVHFDLRIRNLKKTRLSGNTFPNKCNFSFYLQRQNRLMNPTCRTYLVFWPKLNLHLKWYNCTLFFGLKWGRWIQGKVPRGRNVKILNLS